MKTTYPMIPFSVIVAAMDGDTEAINQIVKITAALSQNAPSAP